MDAARRALSGLSRAARHGLLVAGRAWAALVPAPARGQGDEGPPDGLPVGLAVAAALAFLSEVWRWS